MTFVFGLLLVGGSALVGLLLLVAITGLPLWALSIVTTLVQGLLVPLSATAHSMLYGDAAAQHDEASELDEGTEAITVDA